MSDELKNDYGGDARRAPHIKVPIAIVPVYPQRPDRNHFPTPISDGRARSALVKALFPEHDSREIIGLIVCSGRIEDMDFRGSDASLRARATDAVALWFESASIPTVGAQRTGLSEQFTTVTEYAELGPLVRALVRGIENQLARRVVAVGAFFEGNSYCLSVPIDVVERDHGAVDKNQKPITSIQPSTGATE